MQIDVRTAGEVKVLSFDGRLDGETSADAQLQFNQLIEDGTRKFVVNFEKLNYISSAGLRVLLAAAKQLKPIEGELRICGIKDAVQDVFDISGFSTILNIFDSESDALNDF